MNEENVQPVGNTAPVEPIVQPVVPQDTVQATPAKSVDDVMRELDTTNKRVKDLLSITGKQATEIGDLRKEREASKPPEPQVTDGVKSELVNKLMLQHGMDKETAEYNAKLLSEVGGSIIEKRLNERMMNEVIDRVEDAFDAKTIDQKFWTDNENDIMSEFRMMKPADTAGKNYRILKRCYNEVKRRKADVLRRENGIQSEANRDTMIAGQTPTPPGGTGPIQDTGDEAARETIRSAGVKRQNAFF